MSNHQIVQNEVDRLSQKKRKEMTSRDRVRLLQLKLYQKAKQEKEYRFYILYDKIFQAHILEEAYRLCRAKNGSPGIDRQSFKDTEQNGREQFLAEIKEELRTRTYKPQAVKRVWLEKENGGERPLGIPTIKDRVVQRACILVIEPIFEADFNESSYGFRPKRSAKGAIAEIRNALRSGNHTVYDADLSKYFDTIPHDKLEVALKERIADPRVLHLIKLWLKAPIVESGQYSGGKGSTQGTPQGGVISPLLANVYMNLIDRVVNNPKSQFSREGIRMVRYADDFILLAKAISQNRLAQLHGYLNRMGLIINQEKSKLVNAKETPFDFLGFTFRYDRSILYQGTRFWNIRPRDKSQKRIRQRINEKLKSIGHFPPDKVVEELNPMLRGWISYYSIDKISSMQVPLRKLDEYLRNRLTWYYNRKSQRKSRLYGQQAYDMLVKDYGLIQPYVTSGLRPVNAQG